MKFRLVLLLLAITASLGFSQVEMAAYNEHRGPRFHLNTFAQRNPDNPETNIFNIYLEVRNDELQFIKMADGFGAGFEVSVVILDKDGDQVDGKIWKEEVFVERFDDTNATDQYSFTRESFVLEPGEYKIHLIVTDLETEIEAKQTLTVEMLDYSGKNLSLSEIALIRDVQRDADGNIVDIIPLISTVRRGLEGKAFAYFEIYNPKSATEAEIETQLSGRNTRKRVKNESKLILSAFKTAHMIPINADSLEHDAYTLKIKVKAGGDDYEIEKRFFIRWEGLPNSSQDLETAIEQVKYIATREEWKLLDKAPPEKKMEEFQAFWKRHDPTPGTEANEAMEAHYSRVEYANENFSVMQREGWKTDMGMVFIILGAPDDIERNAYPRGSKPYEIWRYYRYNRDLLFYDYTGFGEYRLATPFSIYEFQRYLQQR